MATVKTPAGETWTWKCGSQWKFASFYRTPEGGFAIRLHRTEAAAAKGSWDSPSQREAQIYAGYAPIVH